ncbi:hypothetical protein QAD02_022038 [Eretmocerus hayati]|uniref:Uncharacterized protein n=1 Tax=Eretmocerus hayati TaxID=131215 RepID=A0ACC2PRL9_9HYME|nr:hypothetical protein QAD02_022038 [Eretmocerus hayati]
MPLHAKLTSCCLVLANAGCQRWSNASTSLRRGFSLSCRSNMRFVQFVNKGGGPQQLGVQLKQGGDIVAISVINSRVPNTLKKLLEGGEEILKKAKRIVAEGRSVIPEKDVVFLPPITKMDKLACVGLNYSGHCKEQNVEPPSNPVIFSKFPSNVIGPYDDIHLPTISDKVDWEAELAIVIGKKCKSINNHEADEYIFGYTVAQDLSARDWQKGKRNGGQFLLGKAMDNFCPLGPAVVAKESIADVKNLAVRTYVNGQIKQDGNTSELIFKTNDIVAYLSQFMTLLPGDVILTGTPGGVGFTRNPPEYLKKGDVLETEIEGIGRLKNNVL